MMMDHEACRYDWGTTRRWEQTFGLWVLGFGFGHLHLSATYQQQFHLFWLGLVARAFGEFCWIWVHGNTDWFQIV
jgi:hypothetical protein